MADSRKEGPSPLSLDAVFHGDENRPAIVPNSPAQNRRRPMHRRREVEFGIGLKAPPPSRRLAYQQPCSGGEMSRRQTCEIRERAPNKATDSHGPERHANENGE